MSEIRSTATPVPIASRAKELDTIVVAEIRATVDHDVWAAAIEFNTKRRLMVGLSPGVTPRPVSFGDIPANNDRDLATLLLRERTDAKRRLTEMARSLAIECPQCKALAGIACESHTDESDPLSAAFPRRQSVHAARVLVAHGRADALPLLARWESDAAMLARMPRADGATRPQVVQINTAFDPCAWERGTDGVTRPVERSAADTGDSEIRRMDGSLIHAPVPSEIIQIPAPYHCWYVSAGDGVRITARARNRIAFVPENFFISSPLGGTCTVNDILIDDVSQLAPYTDLPGELFSYNVLDPSIALGEVGVNAKLEVVVTRTSGDPGPFYGLIRGTGPRR